MIDIYASIENIENYIGSKRMFEAYDETLMLQHAVERNIEIIGEAMNSLLKMKPNISNSRRIVDARNKIVHGYDEIENTQVWSIVVNHLPVLKKKLNYY